MERVKVVVIGAGVVGLSSGVCVAEQLPYCSVSVLAEKFSPDTTSDGAAGILLPPELSDVPLGRQQHWFRETFEHLQAIAGSPQASEAGVSFSSGFQIFREVPCQRRPFWAEVVLGFRSMTPQEMKRFPRHKFGQSFTTVKCECVSYLPWLEKRFRAAGGHTRCEKVTDLRKLALTYDIIVNCSGLGSRDLVPDQEVRPVRGQILKVHAPWLKNFVRDGDGSTYIYPGVAHVTLGGTRQECDWRLGADPRDSEGILERCRALEPSLGAARVGGWWVGLRPARPRPRVEMDAVQVGGRRVPVVHNYGHGGGGVGLSWGTALDVLDLVRQSVLDTPPRSRL